MKWAKVVITLLAILIVLVLLAPSALSAGSTGANSVTQSNSSNQNIGIGIEQKNRPVEDVQSAFDNLNYQGEWLGAMLNKHLVGPNGTEEFELFPAFPLLSHVQGMARSPRTGRAPVFYLAVSTGGKSWDSVAGIMVVEMESLATHGERLGSNRLKINKDTMFTSPPPEDRVIKFIETESTHPSGLSMVGDILAVPMDGKIFFYNCKEPDNPVEMSYKLPLVDYEQESTGAQGVAITQLPDGRFLLVTDTDKGAHFYFSFPGIDSFYKPNGDEQVDIFHRVVTATDTGEEFYELAEYKLLDPAYLKSGEVEGYWPFKKPKSSTNKNNSRLFQGMNFVNQEQLNSEGKIEHSLFLIGHANAHEYSPQIASLGVDELYLLEVYSDENGDKVKEDLSTLSADTLELKGISKSDKRTRSPGTKHNEIEREDYRYYTIVTDGWKTVATEFTKRQQANLNAGAGSYVTPSGELLYYASSHFADGGLSPGANFNQSGRKDDYKSYDFVKMAEWSHQYVAADGQCGVPQFREDHLGGDVEIFEGSDGIELDGRVYMVEPWLRMYQKDYDKMLQSTAVMMDWRTQGEDDYHHMNSLDGEFGECRENNWEWANDRGSYNGFANCMSSFQWCGPSGSTLQIMDKTVNDDNWEAAKTGDNGWIACSGTGETVTVEGFSPTPVDSCAQFGEKAWGDFDEDANAARIIWNDSQGNEWTPEAIDSSYEWELGGDGEGELLPDPEHPYRRIYIPDIGSSVNIIRMTYMTDHVVTTKIIVKNLAPEIVSLKVTEEAFEGDQVVVEGEWQDYSDTCTVSVNWGDETAVDVVPDTASRTFDFSHIYGDNGTYNVTLCVADADDETCESREINVTNVVPAVLPIPDQEVQEGDLVSLAPVEFTDPGTLDSHSSTVDWGDTSAVDAGAVIFSAGSGTISGAHVYADDGVYTVEVCVNDDDMDDSEPAVCGYFAVTVQNVKPTIDAGSDQIIFESDFLELDSAIFKDMGTLDTHTANVNWGDGFPTEPGLVVESPFGPPGSTDGAVGEVTGSHQYVVPPGFYTVTVCVRDDDMENEELDVCDSLLVTVVHGFMRFCAYGNEKEVQIEEGAYLDCSAGGEDKIGLKKDSSVTGDIVGGSDVKLEEGSMVGGSIFSAGKVELKKDAAVAGGVFDYVDIPFVTQVDFTISSSQPGIRVNNGGFLSIAPGSYKTLLVEEGATLQLSDGRYFFQSIKVEKNATVEFLIAAEKSTIIEVEKNVNIHEGVTMVATSGSPANILWKVAGNGVVLGKEAEILGTILAPNAHIDIHEAANLTGVLYANKVQIKKDGSILYVPAIKPFINEFLP